MIRRLLWKEFREQAPFALAALLAPPAILLFVRVVLKGNEPWPSSVGGLLPLYPLFIAWGATRMPREREGGRLTLATLPVRWWQTWWLKGMPAVPWAVLCAAFAYGIGDPSQSDARWWWIDASTMTLAFASALLGGLFWGAAASAVVALAATTGWGVLVDAIPWLTTEDAKGACFWVLAMSLLAASACVVAARSRGAGPRRVSLAIAFPYLLLVVVGVAVFWSRAPGPDEDWDYHGTVGSALSASTGLQASTTDTTGKGAAARYTIAVSDRRQTYRRPIRRSGIPLFLLWTPQEELVFREVVPATRRDNIMVWNPKTEKLRVAARWPAHPPPRFGLGLDLNEAALEPGGTRLALVHTRRVSPLSGVMNHELWVVDLRSDSRRLLHPHLDVDELFWRRDRVYFAGGNDRLWSISLDGGRPRREPYLPPAEGSESR